MTTIKAFTDEGQSRMLAEFLPHESADMYYPIKGASPKFGVALLVSTNIPCWSLAALLKVIGHYTLQTVSDSKSVIIISENGNPISSSSYPQPVDACYELILKLHELNLL